MKKAVILLLLLTSATTALSAASRPEDPRFSKFKQQMMPRVGKPMTVVGTLEIGKLGWWVSFAEWGVDIYATKETDIPKVSALHRFAESRVIVCGTLRHCEAVVTDGHMTGIPEHFFFDVADASITAADEQRKEPNQGLEPRTTAVMGCACAHPAPAVVVAHL